MPGEELRGLLTTGIGQGQHFTRLDSARQQFVDSSASTHSQVPST